MRRDVYSLGGIRDESCAQFFVFVDLFAALELRKKLLLPTTSIVFCTTVWMDREREGVVRCQRGAHVEKLWWVYLRFPAPVIAHVPYTFFGFKETEP